MRQRALRPNFMRGIAAVELALILIFSVPLTSLLLMFGQACLSYTVLQKGVHDAARYMAALPAIEMRDDMKVGQAQIVARNMIVDAARAAHLGSVPTAQSVFFACDGVGCGNGTLPSLIFVYVKLTVNDPLFELANAYLGQNGFTFKVSVTVRYGG